MSKLTTEQKIALNHYLCEYDSELSFYEILESIKNGDFCVWDVYEQLRNNGELIEEIESLSFIIKEAFRSMALDILEEIKKNIK